MNPSTETKVSELEDSSQSTEVITPEEVKLYESQARRAAMWLSSYMKMWLRGYLLESRNSDSTEVHSPQLSSIAERVAEHSPVPDIMKFFSFLETFSNVSELSSKALDEQLELLSMFKSAQSSIAELGKLDELSVFLSLPNDGEILDEEELQQLFKELRHDLKSAVENGITFEFTDYRRNPFTGKLDHIRNIWKGISQSQSGFYISESKDPSKDPEKYSAQISEKKQKIASFSDTEIAGMLLDMNDLLNAFNLESGGGNEDPVTLRSLSEYLDDKLSRLRKQYPQLSLTFNTNITPGLENHLTYLNIPTASRILTNAVTNVARVGTGKVDILYSVNKTSVTLQVDDNGTGFPIKQSDVTAEDVIRIISGKKIIPYQIKLGKTSWQNAKGTGTGLFGLQRLVTSHLKGEFIVGNRYGEQGLEGGTLAAIVPVLKKQANSQFF